jgi:hypothetical protein
MGLVFSVILNEGNYSFFKKSTILPILGPSSTLIFPKKLITISTTTKNLTNIAKVAIVAVRAA